jgi:hypothetical protein
MQQGDLRFLGAANIILRELMAHSDMPKQHSNIALTEL